jgi:hypothetical protein
VSQFVRLTRSTHYSEGYYRFQLFSCHEPATPKTLHFLSYYTVVRLSKNSGPGARENIKHSFINKSLTQLNNKIFLRNTIASFAWHNTSKY